MSVVSGVHLENFLCKPWPVAVKVPPPSFWPRHVKLWRCMGYVYSPDTFECGMKKEDHVLLKVKLSPYDDYEGIVPVTNHTQCGSQCIVKKKDCDNATHTLNPYSCMCNCRNSFACETGKVRVMDFLSSRIQLNNASSDLSACSPLVVAFCYRIVLLDIIKHLQGIKIIPPLISSRQSGILTVNCPWDYGSIKMFMSK